MVADDDIGALGQRQFEGIGREELGSVGETGLTTALAGNLDDWAFLDEQDLPRPGAQRHEAQQAAAAAEVEDDMLGSTTCSIAA